MKHTYLFLLALLLTATAHGQLLTNNGALIHVQAGAGLYVVNGDVLVTTNGVNHGLVNNLGHIEVRNGDVTATVANTRIDNRDTMDVRGNLTVSANAALELHGGSGLRVTNNFSVAANTFTAAATSLVHFDGAKHNSGTPSAQDVTTNVDFFTLALATATAPTANAFGNVKLTTPGLNLSVAPESNLVINGSLDFSDGPSYGYVTNSGEAAETNVNQANIIRSVSPTVGLVMASTANYNTIGSATLSILDEPGAATAVAKHQRDYVVGPIMQYASGDNSYLFPHGGTMDGVECLQAYRLNFSAAPAVSGIVRMSSQWYATTMANIAATHCIAPGTPAAEQWTGTWTWNPFDITGFPVLAAAGGLTYNVSLRPVNTAPSGTAGTGIKHSLATDPAIVNCAASAFNLTSTLPMVLFSEGGGYHIPTPLPVEQLAIQATPVGDHIRVDWTTSAETNSSHYDLQRSLNGTDFATMETGIPAAGNTTLRSSYSRPDFAVQPQVMYYYRVVQYDLDGANTLSPVVQAILGQGTPALSAHLFPNPATQQLSLRVFSPEAQTATLTMYDHLGKRVHTQQLGLANGTQFIDLTDALARLTDGQYAVVLQAGNTQWQDRLIKLKD